MQPKIQGSYNILKIGRNLSFFPASYSKKTKWMLEMDLQVNTLAVLHVCTYIHTYYNIIWWLSNTITQVKWRIYLSSDRDARKPDLVALVYRLDTGEDASCVLKDLLVFTQGWSSCGRNCQVHRDQGDIQYCFSLTSKIQCSGRLVVLGFGGKEEI